MKTSHAPRSFLSMNYIDSVSVEHTEQHQIVSRETIYLEGKMATYETGRLTFRQKNIFLFKFDNLVGTDREVDKHDMDYYTIVCYELLYDEIDRCRDIEREILKKA